MEVKVRGVRSGKWKTPSDGNGHRCSGLGGSCRSLSVRAQFYDLLGAANGHSACPDPPILPGWRCACARSKSAKHTRVELVVRCFASVVQPVSQHKFARLSGAFTHIATPSNTIDIAATQISLEDVLGTPTRKGASSTSGARDIAPLTPEQ